MDDILSYVVAVVATILALFLKSRENKGKDSGQKQTKTPAGGRKPARTVMPAWQDCPTDTDAEVRKDRVPEEPFILAGYEAAAPRPVAYASARPAAPQPQVQEEEKPSEYAFRSIEDVRKAVIWTEILQRKY